MWNFNSPKKIDKQWQNHGESIDRWTTRSAFQLPPGPGPSCMTRCPSIHGFHPQLKSDEGCLKSHLLSSNYMLAAWCYSHQYDSIIFDDFQVSPSAGKVCYSSGCLKGHLERIDESTNKRMKMNRLDLQLSNYGHNHTSSYTSDLYIYIYNSSTY